jgi:hypothetical protein
MPSPAFDCIAFVNSPGVDLTAGKKVIAAGKKSETPKEITQF